MRLSGCCCSALHSPILWHPEFGAGWKLKRFRQDPNDSVWAFVDIQSFADQRWVAVEPPLPKRSRHYHDARACGLIFLIEKLPAEQGQDLSLPEECARHCCAVHFLNGISDADIEQLEVEAVRRGRRSRSFCGTIAGCQHEPQCQCR